MRVGLKGQPVGQLEPLRSRRQHRQNRQYVREAGLESNLP